MILTQDFQFMCLPTRLESIPVYIHFTLELLFRWPWFCPTGPVASQCGRVAQNQSPSPLSGALD